MSSISDFLISMVTDILNDVGADVLSFLILGVIVILGSLPIYLIMKKLKGSKTTFREDVLEAVHFQRGQAPPSPLYRQLTQVQRGVATVYAYILYLVIVLVTGFVIYFFVTLKDDANRTFLIGFVGVLYALFLAWALFQIRAARATREEPDPDWPPDDPNARSISAPVPFQAPPPEAPEPAKGLSWSPQWIVLAIVLTCVFAALFTTVMVAVRMGR